ncbi:hypothetical protein K1719_047459 [Acacia pycnantha]|nr:hypothetical protein K1719_047459 [Acacia pycnantha]
MHDLVKKMGLNIARNQLISDANTPIRLGRHEDIADFFNRGKHFPNLEEIDLSYSEHLTTLLDLSHAPKIQALNLDGCVNLAQIHSSTFPGKVVQLGIIDCWPMQIKLGASIKGRNSGLVTVSIYLNLLNLSFDKVTMKVFICGNMICGVRFKHEVMPLEEIEELRKVALSLGSLLPFVRKVEWFEDPIEFGHDLNQHYQYSCDYRDLMGTGFRDVDKEERGDGGEMMNGHQAVTMSLMEDDKEEEDNVLMEDWSNKSVTFTIVPNSITR